MLRFIATCGKVIVPRRVVVGVSLVGCLVCLSLFLSLSGRRSPLVAEVAAAGEKVPASTTFPANKRPRISPEVETILDSRAQYGSPLSGTILAEGIGPNEVDVAEVFARVAAEEAQAAAESPPPLPTDPAPAAWQPAETGHGEALSALDTAVGQLYRLANEYEEIDYERADEVRRLAREIRGQMVRIANPRSPQPPRAWLAPAGTATDLEKPAP
ncbi:MAG: hypothetical protein WD872_14710 [Pirellulaceae bacterium]